LTASDVGLLAATEAEICKEILEVATAGGIKFKLKDKVAVKKLWILCRKCVEGKSGSGKQALADRDQPLTDEDVEETKGLWSTVHGFVLPEAWILSPVLIGRNSRDVTCTPPRLAVMLAESLRPRSCVEKTPGAVFQALVPGRQTETPVVIADAVTRPIELYISVSAHSLCPRRMSL